MGSALVPEPFGRGFEPPLDLLAEGITVNRQVLGSISSGGAASDFLSGGFGFSSRLGWRVRVPDEIKISIPAGFRTHADKSSHLLSERLNHSAFTTRL